MGEVSLGFLITYLFGYTRKIKKKMKKILAEPVQIL